MDIRLGDLYIGRVGELGIGARAGVAAHALEVRFRMHTHPWPEQPPPPAIIGFSGELSTNSLLVGTLHPRPIYVPILVGQTHQCDLVATCMVSSSQLRALDELRSGRDRTLSLHVELRFDIFRPSNLQTAHSHSECRSTIKLSESDWLTILAAARFEDRATFEVPVLGHRVRPPFDVAAEQMREALDQLDRRQWWPAAVACRKALDELKRLAPAKPPSWNDWSNKTEREGWDTTERLRAAQEAVRHMTHPAAHVAGAGPVEEHEARLLVALTGALLRYYANTR